MSHHLYDAEDPGAGGRVAAPPRCTGATRASVIWAWLAVAIVPQALDLVVDLTERARYAPGFHGLNPASFDDVLFCITGVGVVGLLRELFPGRGRGA